MADKQRQQEDARQKAEADAAAKLRAEEDEKKAAEAAENLLRLPVLERQHLQVALTALGFRTAATDGNFSARTREMIAAWQKTHNDPPTGYLTGAQSQALLRDKARTLEKQAEQLRKLAQTVHHERCVAELAELFKAPEAKIDLATAALLIARFDNEELDIDAYRQRALEEVRQALELLAANMETVPAADR